MDLEGSKGKGPEGRSLWIHASRGTVGPSLGRTQAGLDGDPLFIPPIAEFALPVNHPQRLRGATGFSLELN